ncbi:MAG: metallophosphoesterase family protein [Clostridiales bacterium]|nr:metallophosphoesterase family protein [Clostridiales bacterium]
MKYALIADVHANLYALEAVLRDAAEQGAQKYIFLGDYCQGTPLYNETMQLLRSVSNAVFVSGNEDETAVQMAAHETEITGQFISSYWFGKHIAPGHIAFLASLPEELVVDDVIRAMHKPQLHFEGLIPCEIEPLYYFKCMKAGTFTNETFPAYAAEQLAHDEAFHRRLDELSAGIYVFGHTHIQWHYEHGDKLLINPGSVGIPLAFDTRAAYTMLESTQGGWQVLQRQVDYDRESMLDAFDRSDYSRDVPVWSSVIRDEIATAREHALLFLIYADEYAKSIGDDQRPYSHETWHAAYELWKEHNMK